MVGRAADQSGYLRGGAVEALKLDPVFADSHGERIFNRQPTAAPAWPFTRVETPLMVPTEASDWVGGEVELSVHNFMKGETAAEDIDVLQRRAAAVLDGTKLNLTLNDGETGETPQVVELWHVRSQVLKDDEAADAFHGVVEFTATTAVNR